MRVGTQKERSAGVAETVWQIASCLNHQSFSFATEAELQIGIEETLTANGFILERECRISGRDRVDFMVTLAEPSAAIALECKIKGTRIEVLRQLYRYAESEHVDGVILASSKRSHRPLPMYMSGKLVKMVLVGGLG